MTPRDLIVLERIARNLPVDKVEMGRVDTIFGPVFMAWGRRGSYPYGVWGCRGIAQQLDFKKDIDSDHIKATLLQQAIEFVKLCNDKGLYENPEHFRAQ